MELPLESCAEPVSQVVCVIVDVRSTRLLREAPSLAYISTILQSRFGDQVLWTPAALTFPVLISIPAFINGTSRAETDNASKSKSPAALSAFTREMLDTRANTDTASILIMFIISPIIPHSSTKKGKAKKDCFPWLRRIMVRPWMPRGRFPRLQVLRYIEPEKKRRGQRRRAPKQMGPMAYDRGQKETPPVLPGAFL